MTLPRPNFKAHHRTARKGPRVTKELPLGREAAGPSFAAGSRSLTAQQQDPLRLKAPLVTKPQTPSELAASRLSQASTRSPPSSGAFSPTSETPDTDDTTCTKPHPPKTPRANRETIREHLNMPDSTASRVANRPTKRCRSTGSPCPTIREEAALPGRDHSQPVRIILDYQRRRDTGDHKHGVPARTVRYFPRN